MTYIHFSKKKITYLIILILLLILVFKYLKISANYERQFEMLNTAKTLMIIQDPFINYYLTKGVIPNSIDSLFPFSPRNEIDSLKIIHFNDLLASNRNQVLEYYPLYNRKDTIRDAFIIVSTGIDGKLNNKFDLGDTIFKDNYFKKFNFYNYNNSFKNQFVLSNDTINNKFNLILYLFGKKDYLVSYIDLPEWK